MDETIKLDVLSKESGNIINELAGKNMVIARSKNDFLYIIESDGGYLMFSHTPGSPEGGQKQFPKDEKNIAIINNIASLADALFKAEYDENLKLHGVLASVEEGILSLFPGDDRDGDADIEFVIPE